MLCRLCVSECTDFTDIFENKEHDPNISKLISLNFSFDVTSEDQHSTKICPICLESLRNFNLFCQNIENAQTKWQTILNQNKEEPESCNDSYSDCNANEEIKQENQKSEHPNGEKKILKSILSEQYNRLIAENSNLICNECNKPMESFKLLKKHCKLSHNKVGYMICCKRKFFSAADLADHINLHLNPNYFKCETCDKCFSSRYSLDFHIKTCHIQEDQEVSFKCKHCPRKLLSRSARDKHESTHGSYDPSQTDEKNHHCVQCGKSYPNEIKLKAHDINVHKMGYRRMCHLCGKTVRGNKALERHQLLHSGIKMKQECNICGALLSTKGILKAHMIALHPEDSNITFICSICGKNSPSQRALKNHIDYVHKCERSHKCSLCEKSFKNVQALKEHLTTHTGDRLYECPHCPKTFKVRANMHHHRKLKHPKEFEENRRKRINGK